MEVILLSRIEQLGDLGDIVRVKPGYARNYLIPQKKAKFATPENIAEFERRKAELKRQSGDELTRARARQEKLDGISINVTARVSGGNKLFGSVGSAEIIEAIRNNCAEEVQRREVRLPKEALREIGTFPITLALHADVDAVIKVNIVAEE